MKALTKLTQTFHKASRSVSKNSPAILTGVGIVGLGATAFLSYKAAKKVEAIVEGIEEHRETQPEVELNRVEVVRDLAGVLALPIFVGVGSVICIGASYQILNNRNNILAGALGVAVSEHNAYRHRVKEEYGEEVDERMALPVDQETREVTDSKGKVKEEKEDVKSPGESMGGRWFDESQEYAADDHSYNMAYINSVNEKLQLRMFQRGYLLLNEVLEELGFERTRSGALFGWDTSQSFSMDTTINKLRNMDTGFLEPQIWVRWNKPKYIYDQVDLSGRYSQSGY